MTKMNSISVSAVMLLSFSICEAQSFDNGKASTARDEAVDRMTASCRTAVERFRKLPIQSGKSPLAILTSSDQTGIAVAPNDAALDMGALDLDAWARSQSPPIELPEALKVRSGLLPGMYPVAFSRLPTTAVYAVHSEGGTMHCVDSIYFEVKYGKAQIVQGPPREEGEDGDSECMLDRSFGTIDQSPVMFEERYIYSPRLTSTLEIATWEGDHFAAACRITFEFEPEFTSRTLNSWNDCGGEPCDCIGEHCDRLREAAYRIVGAIQENPQAARSNLTALLSDREAPRYSEAETAASSRDRGVSKQDSNDPTAMTDTFPFRVPYVQNGRVYVVSAGHFTIGWREFADWSVNFHEVQRDQLIERAKFAIGMWKGKLKGASVEPPPRELAKDR